MTVIRKNIITDTVARDKYVRGVLLLKKEQQTSSSLSTYDAFVVWHARAMMKMTPLSQSSRNAAHRGPSFLPWHRFFLIVLEQQIQRVLNDASFGLPYWAWNVDGDKAAGLQVNQPIWAANCMGGTGLPVTSGPFANPTAQSTKFLVNVEQSLTGSLVKVKHGLRRQLANLVTNLPSSDNVKSAIAMPDYDEIDWNVASTATFRNVVEGWSVSPAGNHNRVHVWVGGDMLPGTSPNDPVFFLNHCNVDRIWAAWQQKHGTTNYVPPQTAPASLNGHRPDDKLFSVYPNPPKVKDMFGVAQVYAYDALSDLT